MASRNSGNEANIEWFLSNVWPRLQGTGAVLDVVGTIAGYFEYKQVPQGCILHGSVPALATYYANADVVALPVVTGGGVAIKTIEALLHERPICATSHAFRGLGISVRSRFPRLDDAAAFAEDLRSLVENPGAARQRLELCREAAEALAPERFDEAFDKRHRAMLAGGGGTGNRDAGAAGLGWRALFAKTLDMSARGASASVLETDHRRSSLEHTRGKIAPAGE